MKCFTTPYVVAGSYKKEGWADGMGGNVRLNKPREGCFVKNSKYEGQEDEYDFYFCDQMNHCIRKMTPEGGLVHLLVVQMEIQKKDIMMEIYVKKPVLHVLRALYMMRLESVFMWVMLIIIVFVRLLWKNNK